MGVLSEPEVAQFRAGYYRLLARLLAAEPDAELLQGLADGLEQRTRGAAQVHPTLGDGWRTLAAQLHGDALPELLHAYGQLFLDPYGEPLNPYESYYVAGRLYGEPLAEVRAFMARQHLELAAEQRREPEDALHCELATLATLAERQVAGGDADPAAHVEAQREFLERHLLVWAPACLADLTGRAESAESAFYRGVGLLLQGFLEVEGDFFREDGGLQVEPLDEARRRHHAQPFFKGEVFDAEQGPPAQGAPEQAAEPDGEA